MKLNHYQIVLTKFSVGLAHLVSLISVWKATFQIVFKCTWRSCISNMS